MDDQFEDRPRSPRPRPLPARLGERGALLLGERVVAAPGVGDPHAQLHDQRRGVALHRDLFWVGPGDAVEALAGDVLREGLNAPLKGPLTHLPGILAE